MPLPFYNKPLKSFVIMKYNVHNVWTFTLTSCGIDSNLYLIIQPLHYGVTDSGLHNKIGWSILACADKETYLIFSDH